MTSITVFVKLLNGDQVSLEVAPYLSSMDLYVAAFHALPDEVRPEEVYALQLFRALPGQEEQEQEQEEKGEHGALPFTEERIRLVEGDHFFVLLSAAEFRVELLRLGEGIDIEEEEFFYPYERYSLAVYYDTRIVFQKQFYVTPFREQTADGTLYMRLIQCGAHISATFEYGNVREEGGEFFRGTSDLALDTITERFELLRTVVVDGPARHKLYTALYEAWDNILEN